jgi:hypothetical protein
VSSKLTTAAVFFASLKPLEPPPIVASYDLPDGTAVYAEPRRYEWSEDGLVMHFRWHVTEALTSSVIELRINDVVRAYDPLPHSTLAPGDTFSVAILLPYD